MPFYLFPYFYSLLAAGDLLDHTDVRHNDIVAGGLLQMNVWNVWKTLVEAAATNDVDYVSTEVLQQSLLDFHVIWCCLIIYNINWNKYHLWHICWLQLSLIRMYIFQFHLLLSCRLRMFWCVFVLHFNMFKIPILMTLSCRQCLPSKIVIHNSDSEKYAKIIGFFGHNLLYWDYSFVIMSHNFFTSRKSDL